MPESLLPGGTVVVDHRNLFGKGHSLTGTVTTSNILDPQDLGYRLEYKRPYIYGEPDPNRTALAATAFNARRLSGTGHQHLDDGILWFQHCRACPLRRMSDLRRFFLAELDFCVAVMPLL